MIVQRLVQTIGIVVSYEFHPTVEVIVELYILLAAVAIVQRKISS